MKIIISLIFLTSCALLNKLEEKKIKSIKPKHLIVKKFEKVLRDPFIDIWQTSFPVKGKIKFTLDKNAGAFTCRAYGKEEIPLPPLLELQIHQKQSKINISKDIYKIRCFSDKQMPIVYTVSIDKMYFHTDDFPNKEFHKAIQLKNKYLRLKKDLANKNYSPELNLFLKQNNFFYEQTFKIKAKDDFKPFAVLHRDEQLIIKHVKGRIHRQYVNANNYGPNGKRRFKPSKKMLVENLPPFSLICGSLNQSERFEKIYFYGKGPHHIELNSTTPLFCNINRRLDKDYFLTGEFEFLYQIVPESVKTIISSSLVRLNSEILHLKIKKQKLIENYKQQMQ